MDDGNWLYSSGGTSTVLEPEQAIEAYQECLYPDDFGIWGWVEAGYYVSITEHDGSSSQSTSNNITTPRGGIIQQMENNTTYVTNNGANFGTAFQVFIDSDAALPFRDDE
jgi:hypothetical protein